MLPILERHRQMQQMIKLYHQIVVKKAMGMIQKKFQIATDI